jgi:glycosyltransferase involved in cell wall biosynthesis
MLRIWSQALRENAGDPSFLARTLILLPKAVYYAQEMEAEGIEHIHAHYATHPALAAWVIHRLTGISYSITVHAHDIFVSQSMLATKLRDADFIVAISEYNRRFLSDTLGSWVEAKTYVVHCGIEPALYAVGLRSDVQSDAAQTPIEDRFEILNIGSLQPYKGHSYLIEACALLKARHIPFRCRIVGGGDPAGLQKLIDERDLRQEVQLLGPLDQTQVALLITTADCYVQPSIITPSGKMEGIPVAIMEAMAAQRPVVATAISGVPELVQPGKTGYLVLPGDALALADALAHVYTHPAEAAALAAAGRILAIAEYNLHTNVEHLCSLFQRDCGDTSLTAAPSSRLVTTYQE